MNPYFQNGQTTLHQGSVFEVLPHLSDELVDCIVTSPPYWNLRDYGHPGQIGDEPTISEYIANLVEVFEECRRILKPSGTFWLNISDTYAPKWAVSRRNQVGNKSLKNGTRKHRPDRLINGLKEKDLCLIPQRLAISLQHAGWYVRQDIIWHKTNPLPESVRDRYTRSHEYLWLLSKSSKYFWNYDAIQELATSRHPSAFSFNRETKEDLIPGQQYKQHRLGRKAGNKKHKYVDAYQSQDSEQHRTKAGLLKSADKHYQTRNPRSVWSMAVASNPDAHFATFPPELPRRCIEAGCPEGGTVLDPFAGSGTTLWQAQELGRKAIGIELNPEYCRMALNRCRQLTIFGALT